MAFNISERLFAPLKLIYGLASPVAFKISLSEPTEGKQASVKVTVTSTVKDTEVPAPMGIELRVNGQTVASEFAAGGAVSKTLFFDAAGEYTVEASASDSERFRDLFGPFLPYGSRTITVLAVYPQTRFQHTNQQFDAPVVVNGRTYSSLDVVNIPLVDDSVRVRAVFPEIAGKVFSVSPMTFDQDISSDTTINTLYNAPSNIVTNLQLPNCIRPGTVENGQLNAQVLDLGGNGFQVPLLVNGVLYGTDSLGNVSIPITVDRAGTYPYNLQTDTPIPFVIPALSKTIIPNVPTDLSLEARFEKACLRASEEANGVLNALIRFTCNPYSIPIVVNGRPYETDSEGKLQVPLKVTGPGTFQYDAITQGSSIARSVSVEIPPNLPTDLSLGAQFEKACLRANEEASGVLNILTKFTCTPFRIPLLVNGRLYEADSEGKLQVPLKVTGPGTFQYDVVTQEGRTIARSVSVEIPLNLPTDLSLEALFEKTCLLANEEASGVLNILTKFTCTPFRIPLLVNGGLYEADSEGKLQVPLKVTGPGTFQYNVVTQEGRTIGKSTSITFPVCPLPKYRVGNRLCVLFDHPFELTQKSGWWGGDVTAMLYNHQQKIWTYVITQNRPPYNDFVREDQLKPTNQFGKCEG